MVGLSPAAPRPVPIPGLPRGSEQGGKGHTLQSQPPPTPTPTSPPRACSGRTLRAFCPAHQDLSEFLFLAFPRLLPVHLSGFLPRPKIAERKKNRLLHLRSNYASNFPFPFSSFLQSAFSGAHQLREAALHHSLMGKFKVLGFGRWGPACKFELCHLLAELLNAFDSPFPHL